LRIMTSYTDKRFDIFIVRKVYSDSPHYRTGIADVSKRLTVKNVTKQKNGKIHFIPVKMTSHFSIR
jgi:hypothetical protein